MIPCANPHAQYAVRREAIDAAVAQVLEKGRYILGVETESFEREFAEYLGVRYAIGVGSGTEALHLALRACNIGPGDEVITVSHTAVATVAAIELCGATPVLADIEPETLTIDPERIQPLIGPRAKAIIPVHLYGQPAELDAVRAVAARHGLRVIEDCAQSHGASYRGRRVGSWGELGCFSFYPTKNLGALGDGGMVVTDSTELAERTRLLREYGWGERYVSAIAGLNSRLDEIQAGVLRVKLRDLDADNEKRMRLARRYGERLEGAGITLPHCRVDRTHVYHLYVVRCERRDELKQFLARRDIGAMVHYPAPVHLQPAYRGRLRGHEHLKESERAAGQVLSLPMYPELRPEDVDTVADAVLAFIGEGA